MKIPQQILLKKGLEKFLLSRQLDKQYQKAKRLLLEGSIYDVDFKLRKPLKDGIWYFRINHQYRVIGIFQGETFYIIDIDDHQ